MTGNFGILLRGFIIGISIAAPVGPIGILCIRRTLAEGRLSGFLSGLGAATADMVYGAIAAFGLSAIMGLLTGQADSLRLFGGIFLVYLGIRTIFSKPTTDSTIGKAGGMLSAYLSTLVLTLTNPMTILSFLAIFAGVLTEGGEKSPYFLVAGVFTGSAVWWLGLSLGVGMIRRQLDARGMTWINRISGAVILIFAIVILLGVR